MPIYEYRCEACGHEVEALQKISDSPLTDCPGCNEPKLRRLVSAPAFRLKGGGWYETDFKSDKEKKRNLAESSSEPPKADKGDGKADGSKDKKPAKSDAAPKPAKAESATA